MQWWRALFSKLRPAKHEDDLPPPIHLPEIPADHDRLLQQAQHDIRHRERILRVLEARANVLGHDLEGRSK